MSLNIIILAAGRGTRMRSEKPKVLHELAGKPMLAHVIETAKSFPNPKIQIVVGYQANQIKECFNDEKLIWVEQKEQKGTGHAVQQCLTNISEDDRVLILYGDVPLIKNETLASLINAIKENEIGVLTAYIENPAGFGRILRDEYGAVSGIVEHQDASETQKKIKEINSGIMLVPGKFLIQYIPNLRPDNLQEELYLTDLISIAVNHSIHIKTAEPSHLQEVLGVNDRVQLINLERYHQRQLAEKLILKGVNILDPNRVDFRGEVSIGEGSTIDVNVVFQGNVVIGRNVTIGPNVSIINTRIEDNAIIYSNSVIEESVVGASASIGPFARLRAGTVLAAETKVGNFVETKKAQIGKKSKINHLSYIGDAEVGESVNIGAGTITCNYDGVNKHKTKILDQAFIGSGTQLVAPVTVGKKATIGAGTTLTQDAPDDALTLTRVKQKTNLAWKRPIKINKLPTTE